MNITKKVVDDVNIILSLEIVKADYNDAVEKAIKDARKNMQMPGFRKGMVPASLVRKRFGTEIKVDEVNKLINKGLMDYINENKVNVLGEPMVDDSQERVDLATADDFTISFAIAVAPEFTLTLDNSVKVPYYTIKVDDKMVENQVEGVVFAGAVAMAAADVNAGRDRMGGKTPRQLSGQGLFDDLKGRLQEFLPFLEDVDEDVEVDQDFHAYFSRRCFLYSSLNSPSVLSQCNEPMALRSTSGMSSSSSHSATARDSLSFARHWRMTSETEMPYWAAYPWTKVRSALGSRTIRRESFMDDPFWMYDSLTNMYDDGQVGVILDDCEENR